MENNMDVNSSNDDIEMDYILDDSKFIGDNFNIDEESLDLATLLQTDFKERPDRQVVLPESNAYNDDKTVAVIQPIIQLEDKVTQSVTQDITIKEDSDFKNGGVMRFDGDNSADRAISFLEGLRGKCGSVIISLDFLDTGTRKETLPCETPCDMIGSKKPKDSSVKKGKKPSARKGSFPCKICGSVFSQNSNLSRHITTKHKETNFRCKDCNAVFKRQDYLKDHTRRCAVKKAATKRSAHLQPRDSLTDVVLE